MSLENAIKGILRTHSTEELLSSILTYLGQDQPDGIFVRQILEVLLERAEHGILGDEATMRLKEIASRANALFHWKDPPVALATIKTNGSS